MRQESQYRDYTIYYDPKPIPMPVHWSYVHKDYDGEGDHRHGFAASVEAAQAEIDALIEEDA